MKNIVVLFNCPGMTSRQYDGVWEDLRAAGHTNPNGLLYHVGAPTADGWMVIDVWESEDHFNEFGKTLMPIMENNEVPKTEPVVMPLHYSYSSNLAEHHH